VATADGVNRCALHDWRPPTRASREPGSRHSSRGGRRARIVGAVGDGAAGRGKPIVACRSTKDSVYGSGISREGRASRTQGNERSGANRERRVGVLFCNQVGCMLRRGGHSRRTRRDDSEISTAVSPNCRSRSSETRARIWVSDRHSVSEVSRRVQKTGAALSRREGTGGLAAVIKIPRHPTAGCSGSGNPALTSKFQTASPKDAGPELCVNSPELAIFTAQAR
jgi:hypothetical protein